MTLKSIPSGKDVTSISSPPTEDTIKLGNRIKFMDPASKEITAGLEKALEEAMKTNLIFKDVYLEIKPEVDYRWPEIKWVVSMEGSTFDKVKVMHIIASPFYDKSNKLDADAADRNRFYAAISEEVLRIDSLKPLGFKPFFGFINWDKLQEKRGAKVLLAKLQKGLLSAVKPVLESAAGKYGGGVTLRSIEDTAEALKNSPSPMLDPI